MVTEYVTLFTTIPSNGTFPYCSTYDRVKLTIPALYLRPYIPFLEEVRCYVVAIPVTEGISWRNVEDSDGNAVYYKRRGYTVRHHIHQKSAVY